jgi:polysulfide reductase-like protein
MQIGSQDNLINPGYATRRVTKAPTWHGLVTWDLVFNNLTTGLFLVAAISELTKPSVFVASARATYPVALAFLLTDLACLVLDLGDPLRFHHMLRVFKPGSPMSLGTWCLTVYSLLLTSIVAIDWLPFHGSILGWIRWLALCAGLLPALGSAVYKGVLFSTSSQPAWKDARWLGGYLANSAVMLGCAGMLVVSTLMGQVRASTLLRPGLGILLMLNLVPLGLLLLELRRGVSDDAPRRSLTVIVALAVGVGTLIPECLLLAGSGLFPVLGAAAGMLAGSFLIRSAIVKLAHHGA